MSLDIDLIKDNKTVYSANITHNLGRMANKAGIYKCLWRPEKLNIKTAKQLISPLKLGFEKMKNNSDYYRRFDSPNGWGVYGDFLPWIEELLKECTKNPNALIEVDR